MEREIRRRLQLKESNELAIECRRRQKEKEMEEEEAWRAKMLIEMEKVLNGLAVISMCIMLLISIILLDKYWIKCQFTTHLYRRQE